MKKTTNPPTNQIAIYKAKDGNTVVDVCLSDNTAWLSILQIAKLFEKDRSVILRHLHNIFKEKELVKNSTCAKFAQVQSEGRRGVLREIDYYNLDV